MSISAAQVKELRERTGAGMMECKKALESAQGDMNLAIEELRKSGRAKADKKANRIAAEGVIMIRTIGTDTIMLEINSETDFVARDTHFLAFAEQVAKTALGQCIDDVSILAKSSLVDTNLTVEEARQALVAKVGENIHLRRAVLLHTPKTLLGSYLHGTRIGVLVELEGGTPALAKEIAMHIAASRPVVVRPEEVPAELVEKEKRIFMAQAESSGKPVDIIEKMVTGRVKKFLDEVSLIGQPFVKNADLSVNQVLAQQQAKVLRFIRFEVGEGIEKQAEDFVEAVMSQVHGG